MLRHEFQPTGVYLDAATYGLPPKAALQSFLAVTSAWASGRYDPVSCDRAVDGARSTFARLHRVSAADVAIGHQLSPMVGLIAASIPTRARALAAAGDFTSLLLAGPSARLLSLRSAKTKERSSLRERAWTYWSAIARPFTLADGGKREPGVPDDGGAPFDLLPLEAPGRPLGA